MAFVDDLSESILATIGTTGSFQNQTSVVIEQPTCSIVCRQKRDMMAILGEAQANQTFPSNDSVKSTCKVNAQAAIAGCLASRYKQTTDSTAVTSESKQTKSSKTTKRCSRKG